MRTVGIRAAGFRIPLAGLILLRSPISLPNLIPLPARERLGEGPFLAAHPLRRGLKILGFSSDLFDQNFDRVAEDNSAPRPRTLTLTSPVPGEVSDDRGRRTAGCSTSERAAQRRLAAAQKFADALEHAVDVLQHIVVPETEHPVAQLSDSARAFSIFRQLLSVLAAIQLDYDFPLGRAEIGKEGPDGKLAAEFYAIELPGAQPRPKQPLRVRLTLPQRSRPLRGADDDGHAQRFAVSAFRLQAAPRAASGKHRDLVPRAPLQPNRGPTNSEPPPGLIPALNLIRLPERERPGEGYRLRTRRRRATLSPLPLGEESESRERSQNPLSNGIQLHPSAARNGRVPPSGSFLNA